MITLLWKDFRNNLVLVWAGLGLLLLPIIGVPLYVLMSVPRDQNVTWDEAFYAVRMGLLVGSIMALILSQFTMLCLGGQLIAGERATPTAQFLHYLPPTRGQIITSKLIFCLSGGAIIWLVYAGVVAFINAWPMEENGISSGFLLELAAVGIALFGASWMVSSMVESSTLAMGLGALAVVLVAALVVIARYWFDLPDANAECDWLRVSFFFAIGVVGVIAGCIYFIRRVEP